MAYRPKTVYVVNQHIDTFNQLTVWGVFKTKKAVWERFENDRSTDGITKSAFYKIMENEGDEGSVWKEIPNEYATSRVTFFFFKRELPV